MINCQRQAHACAPQTDATSVLAERFWAKVDVAAADACWAWTAALDGHGYGVISVPRERRVVSAHRVSYELAHGVIPDGLHVLHRCDNPRCVNPAHLFIGNARQNMADKGAKGRVRRCRFTADDVRHIRATSLPAAKVAEEYGVSASAVRQVRRRQVWAGIQ